MAKASEQFRQSDVTTWGVVALVCGALAVFGANVSALLPQSLLGGLHQPRIAGASLDSLRLQVLNLTEETTRLRRENDTLVTRFSLQEQAGNEVTRRVGALEVSIPRLVEALPDSADVDRSALTASIAGNPDAALVFNADGGSVVVRQSPLPQMAGPATTTANQPLPDPISTQSIASSTPNEDAFGIAIGPEVGFDTAPSEWNDLTVKLGPLLFGLSPLLTEGEGNTRRIVVGPIADLDEARALCERLGRVAIACLPMPYSGLPMLPVGTSEGG